MAKVIRRIEKEFILGKVSNNRVPVTIQYTNGEAESVLDSVLSDSLAIEIRPGIDKLASRTPINCYFNYGGQIMYFKSRVVGITEKYLMLDLPEELYKDLGRKFSRIQQPRGVQISFSFKGERYDLEFPRSEDFDPVESPEYSADFNADNIKELIEQFRQKADEISPYYRIAMFRERQPEELPEKIIAKIGKALFVSSYNAVLPTVDPYEKKRIITQELFVNYLKATEDMTEEQAVEFIADFFRQRRSEGIVSEIYCPILFHEYAIGYVQIANKNPSRPVFNIEVFDLLHQFAKIISYSLKINGYFKDKEKKPEDYKAQIIDLSASGLLFAHPADSPIIDLLLPNSEIQVRLTINKRVVSVGARIVRRYRDNKMTYLGGSYIGLQPEDMRFLFEYLYGRPFTDSDAFALEGQNLPDKDLSHL